VLVLVQQLVIYGCGSVRKVGKMTAENWPVFLARFPGLAKPKSVTLLGRVFSQVQPKSLKFDSFFLGITILFLLY
jgi:hypothetical protein